MGADMNNDNVKSVGVDASALFNISYGLYVVTTNDGEKDNGCIVNTVVQITASPLKVAVTVNKQNYTCETIVKTGVLNVNCLTESAPFPLLKDSVLKAAEPPTNSAEKILNAARTV